MYACVHAFVFDTAGLIYTYSTGNKQHLYVNNAELVKEMNQCITFDLGKPSYVTKRLAPMLGNGILRSNGPIWAQQRKIVAPEFFMDKVRVLLLLLVFLYVPFIFILFFVNFYNAYNPNYSMQQIKLFN